MSIAAPVAFAPGPVHTMRPLLVALLLPLLSSVACVRAQPPTDTGDPIVAASSSPTAPTANTPAGSDAAPLAYDPDMKTLFQSDCVPCHGPRRADGNYRMDTYAHVMAAVRAGSASSLLVADTQPGGSMYRYWSGSSATRQNKAAQVRSWIVTSNAQERR